MNRHLPFQLREATALLLCVLALNGCTSAPVKPVTNIMPPSASVVHKGTWNPPAPVTSIWLIAPSKVGLYVLQKSDDLLDWQSQFAFGVSSNSTHIFKLPVNGQSEFYRLEKAI